MRSRHRMKRTHYARPPRREYDGGYIGQNVRSAAAESRAAEREVKAGNEQKNGRTYCVMAMPPSGAAVMPMPSVKRTEPSARRSSQPQNVRPAGDSLRKSLRVMIGLLLTVVIMTSPVWLTTDELLPTMKKLSAASASMQLPEEESGGVIEGEIITPDPPQTTTAQAAATTTQTTTSTTQSTEGMRPVSEKQLGNSGTKVGDIYVKNSTGYTPDFPALLKKKADCKIKLNAGYQVLIVHTHTTEGYAQREDGLYDPDYSPRTTDLSKSVVAVGDALAEQLEAAGIKTLHATEVHDYPQYNGSYDRELNTIKKYLEEHPSIEMVLDVHRDAITYEDGTKLKPTAVIDGKKAAQVMIISGCDAGGSLYFPEWESNLSMALKIQQAVQKENAGLMRPLNFAPYRYNMHMTPNSLLLEFGTDVNTLEEAVYSAQLVGKSIAKVLLEYVVD